MAIKSLKKTNLEALYYYLKSFDCRLTNLEHLNYILSNQRDAILFQMNNNFKVCKK